MGAIAHTIWMPTPRRSSIFAPLGWSALVSGAVRYVDGAQPMGLTLKEGET